MKKTFVITLAVTLGLFAAGVAVAARNSGGTFSLPAGNPVVSGTTITSSWANNTLSDIGTEITNSLDRSGRGGMTGQFKATDGTVSAPGITFGNEANSGWYRNTTNDVRLSVNGTDKITVGSATATVNGGTSSVTISTAGGVVANATTGTSVKLQVNGTAYATVSSTDVTFNSIQLKSVADPTAAQDAVTKNYADTAPGGTTAVVASPTWTALTVGGANCSAGTTVPSYTKIKGVVYLRGQISRTIGTAACTLTALPQYYRPSSTIGIPYFVDSIGGGVGAMTISNLGVFTLATPATASATSYISGSFPAEQ